MNDTSRILISIKKKLFLGLFFYLVACFNFISFASAESEDGQREGRIRAAFVFYLAKFVRWPQSRLNVEHFHVCVIGNDQTTAFLEATVSDKMVHSLPIKVSFFSNIVDSEIINNCHIVYLGEREKEIENSEIKVLGQSAILTVSSLSDITKIGGMVYLYNNNNKLAVRINRRVASSANLKVSSELLSIVEIVD